SFTYDGYACAPVYIGIREVASAEESHAHRSEITRPAQPETSLGQETEVACCAVLPFNRVRPAGVVLTCWQSHDRARCGDIGDSTQALDNIVDCLSRAKIIFETGLLENRAPRRRVRIRHEHMIFAETERDVA